jgi:hypothetical protein
MKTRGLLAGGNGTRKTTAAYARLLNSRPE